jgi:branched-chain amino acid transport system permease protein
MVPTHRIFVIACGGVTALALWYLLDRTEFGVRLRATVDDSDMAEALGIRTEVLFFAIFELAVGPRGCLL